LALIDFHASLATKKIKQEGNSFAGGNGSSDHCSQAVERSAGNLDDIPRLEFGSNHLDLAWPHCGLKANHCLLGDGWPPVSEMNHIPHPSGVAYIVQARLQIEPREEVVEK
jgi:hypothetical protein